MATKKETVLLINWVSKQAKGTRGSLLGIKRKVTLSLTSPISEKANCLNSDGLALSQALAKILAVSTYLVAHLPAQPIGKKKRAKSIALIWHSKHKQVNLAI